MLVFASGIRYYQLSAFASGKTGLITRNMDTRKIPKRKSFLLDELRKRADGQPPATQTPAPNENQIRASIDELLWQIHGWLEEVARHLDKLRPSVSQEFHFGNLLTFRALTLESSFVSCRRFRFEEQELLEQIEFFYRLRGPSDQIVRVQASAADETETRMRVAGLSFETSPQTNEWRKVHAVQFKVRPEIKVDIRFEPDYIKHQIGVRLSNVDRFDAMYMVFSPAQLDEDALEDLVRLILGESHAFLKRAPWLTHWRPTRPAFQKRPVRYYG